MRKKKEKMERRKLDKSAMGKLTMQVTRALKGAVKKATRTVTNVPERGVNSTEYVVLLKAVLEKSQIFGEWIEEAPKCGVMWGKRSDEINRHLFAISEFFYTVVCNIIIRDLKTVLKRYVKHCTRSLAP